MYDRINGFFFFKVMYKLNGFFFFKIAFGSRAFLSVRSILLSGTRKKVWDSEYKSGKWNYLKQLDELAHYSIIVGYFNYLKAGGSILDVGCGEGILQERLSPYAYSKYVGIDISDEAINQASQKKDKKTFFIRAETNIYTTESFDAIVFNESLYYFDDPLKVLKEFELSLNRDGIFIISMYKGARGGLVEKLKSSYTFLDETNVTNKLGASWICMVLQPPNESL